MKHETVRSILVAVAIVSLGGGVAAAGDLEGRVLADGEPAPAVVWIEGLSGPVPSVDTEIVHRPDGRFDPPVAVAFVGNEFVFRNEDDELHTTHLYLDLAYQKKVSSRPLKNGATLYNIALPRKDMVVRRPVKPYHAYRSETGPITVRCNPHPKETAYLLVFDHPYAAATDADGRFSLRGVPAGRHDVWVFHDGETRKWQTVEVGATGTVELTIEIAP